MEVARGFMGTPFHHQGRLKGIGVDCIGLLVGVAEELGVELQDCTAYSMHPDGHTLEDNLQKNLDRVPKDEIVVGDVLAFVRHVRLGPQHVGIASYDGRVIHTWAEIGRVVENNMDDRFRRMIHSCWRFRGWPR